jgi:hypothetical protein
MIVEEWAPQHVQAEAISLMATSIDQGLAERCIAEAHAAGFLVIWGGQIRCSSFISAERRRLRLPAKAVASQVAP